MSGEGARGVIIFLSLFYVSTNFKRIFFEKNRRTLFGSLKCRQTLFNAQILFYIDFYDFTHESPVVNAFPSFAIDLREVHCKKFENSPIEHILMSLNSILICLNFFGMPRDISELSQKCAMYCGMSTFYTHICLYCSTSKVESRFLLQVILSRSLSLVCRLACV